MQSQGQMISYVLLHFKLIALFISIGAIGICDTYLTHKLHMNTGGGQREILQ